MTALSSTCPDWEQEKGPVSVLKVKQSVFESFLNHFSSVGLISLSKQ